MSKRLLSFLLSEIGKVRVSCPHCAAVTELTVEQMYRFSSRQCPVCKMDWHGFLSNDDQNHLVRLGKAIHEFQQAAGAKQVEFVFDDPE